MSGRIKSIILLGIPITLAILLSIILQFTLLARQEELNAWLEQFGPYIVLGFIPLQILTIVIAPIGGFFHHIALLALLPPAQALTLIYLVSTPAYMINFGLARLYGRPLVRKIIGQKSLEKIDHLAKDAGIPTFVILKLFQGGIFDYLSYAVGLTRIPFKTFALVNISGGIPSTIITYLIFKQFEENFIVAILAIIATSGILIAISLLITHYLKKHNQL